MWLAPSVSPHTGGLKADHNRILFNRKAHLKYHLEKTERATRQYHLNANYKLAITPVVFPEIT